MNVQTFNGKISTQGIIDEGGVTTPSIIAKTAKVTEIIPTGLNFTANGDEYTVASYIGTAPEVAIPQYFDGKPVTVMAANAFKGSTVSKIIIPETVTNIRAGAFQNCTSLKAVTLPSALEQIGDSAFFGSGLTKATCMAEAVPVTGTNAFNSGLSIRVPYSALELYIASWSKYGNVEPIQFDGFAANVLNPFQLGLIELPSNNHFPSGFKANMDYEFFIEDRYSDKKPQTFILHTNAQATGRSCIALYEGHPNQVMAVLISAGTMYLQSYDLASGETANVDSLYTIFYRKLS